MILITTELKLFRVWLRIFLETLLVIASHLLHLASLFLFSHDAFQTEKNNDHAYLYT